MNTKLSKQFRGFRERAKANLVLAPNGKRNKSNCGSEQKRFGTAPSKTGAQYRMTVFSRILTHMRTCYQHGDHEPRDIEEMLVESEQADCLRSTKNWLTSVALRDHPKFEVLDNGTRFRFKPTYRLKDTRSLMRLLKNNDLRGLGGLVYEDVKESLQYCDRILDKYSDDIITVTRPSDKRKVLFYNDHTADLKIEEEFQKMWRSINVDATNEMKIVQYLDREGTGALQSGETYRKSETKRRKLSHKRRTKRSKDNDHMADILMDFDDD